MSLTKLICRNLFENDGLSFFLPLPSNCTELLPDVLQCKLVSLLDDHQTPLLVVLGYELRLAVTKENSVWEEHLATLDFLIGRQQVLNQLSKANLSPLEDVKVHCFLHIEFVPLLDLGLANSAPLTEEVRVSFVFFSMLDLL